MTSAIPFRLTTAALVAGLLAPLSASASVHWSFTGGGTDTGYHYGNTRTFTSAGNTVGATAWSDSGGSSDDIIETAYLGQWSGSGLGVQNRDESGSSPSHSMDNYYDYDFMLFDFSASSGLFQLSSVDVGWSYTGDSDMSILAYTGPSAPPSVAGKTYHSSNSLSADGWQLVSQVSASGTGTKNIDNTAGVQSSWWIVSAFNPLFGGDTSGIAAGNDKIKIAGLGGHFFTPPGSPPTQVPVPGTVLLLGLGLAAIGWSRRSSTRV